MFVMRFGGSMGRIAYRVLALIERAACSFADHVITVHAPYRREINQLGVPAEKVTVIMNAADERLIGRIRGNGRVWPEEPQSFTVAYHGTLVGHYGVDLLVEAIARVREHLPSVRALVLGDGDQLAELQEQAISLGVRDLIHFSGGYLPINETLGRVTGAQCGVIPNKPTQLNRFALSSKLFEYVELGIPAVVSELATLRAHFGPDEVKFFAPGSSAALAEALLWVAGHPQEAAAMARRARVRAESYSWKRNSRRYLELLGARVDAVQLADSAPDAVLSGPSASHFDSA
jgi:glycosyltransferase involved in cell wall biosynthesis